MESGERGCRLLEGCVTGMLGGTLVMIVRAPACVNANMSDTLMREGSHPQERLQDLRVWWGSRQTRVVTVVVGLSTTGSWDGHGCADFVFGNAEVNEATAPVSSEEVIWVTLGRVHGIRLCRGSPRTRSA